MRAAAGSLFHLPVIGRGPVAGAAPPPCAGGACAWSGPTRTPTPPSTEAPLAEPVALVLGNEAHGLPAEIAADLDLVVRVPLAGRAESLNLAAAAAVLLYETARQQASARRPPVADSEAYLEALPDAVVVVDAEGRIAYANAAAERLARAGRDELAGTAARRRRAPARRRRQPLVGLLGAAAPPPRGAPGPGARAAPGRRAASRSRSTSPPASSATPPAGSSRRSAWSGTPRPAARGDSQRGELISTLAHELRSPLTSVKGFTSTLLHRWERFTDDQKREMLATVNMDADRVTRLIRELLDVSRIDAGRLELRRKEFDLAAMAEGIVGRFELQHDGHTLPALVPGRVPARLC